MHIINLVILGGWAAFWVYWLLASGGAKASQSTSTRHWGIRVGVVVAVVLFLHTGPVGHVRFGDPWIEGAGLALFVTGLALAIWARLYLGRNWGMPMTRRVDPDLVTSGPYHRVRHPIYSGMLLALIGTAIAINLVTLLAVVVLGGYFLYSAHSEERFMESCFPESYPQYKRSSKMLIPFVF
jgi:protein-S-isoprenylcysteine O-methyltransferase Ste14